jgi:hypothetical protein
MTHYYYIEFYWDDSPKEVIQDWVSVGTPPEPHGVEDEHTVYHFDNREWNLIKMAVGPNKWVKTSGGFTIRKVIGGGDV